MIVQSCTTSTETQLAALGDLMLLLGATASSSGMDRALTAATSWAERYITTRRDGSIRRWVGRETVAGSGSQQLMLSRLPVQRVVRMFDSTDTGNATEYCSTDFRIENAEAGFVTLTSDAGFAWDKVVDWNIEMYPRPAQVTRRWMVEYEAGWQYACSSSTGEWATVTTGRTVPDDVSTAIAMKAAEFYDGGTPQSSMRVGPLALTYNTGGDDIGPAEQLLAAYRSLE